MKKKLVILFMFILSLFCGCSCHRVYKPLKESQIISYVEQKIYEETGHKITAKIVSKKQLRLERGCTSCISIDPVGDIVVGGHEYKLEIIDQSSQRILGIGIYKDGYYFTADDVRNAEFWYEKRYLKKA